MTQDLKKRLLILGGVLVLTLLFLYPTASVVLKKISGKELSTEDRDFSSWISKPISLGLDLSGGAHLVYEVNAGDAVASRSQIELSSIRSDLRKEKVAVTRAKVAPNGNIEISLYNTRTLDKAKRIIEQSYKELDLLETKEQGGAVTLIYGKGPQEVAAIKRSAISQAVETLRARVDKFGVSEPIIQKVGEKRILLQLPGEKDIESVKKIVGRVAKLEFRLVALPNASPDDVVSMPLKDDGSPVKLEQDVLLTGAAVDDAQVSFTDRNQVEVLLNLSSEGGKVFGKITGENVGRNLAIILDKEVYSYPTINERIGGGMCSISGGFDIDEARELAVVLRAGALPASLEVLEETTVGPSLGEESIKKGILAIVIGFALILGFMAFYYRKSGLIASGILGLNIIFILAILSAFGATLTLPGLAGLALTVGMAVDANVIIFERIREELRAGAGRDAAVNSGFSKALSAILDANITSLIAALLLYKFGSGPVRGFALTLSIGVITTIFCATFVSRIGFDFFDLKGKDRLSI